MLLPIKNWVTPSDSHQKFLAAVLAYGLSKKLDRKHFEAVNESHLDLHSYASDIPDVIVYDVTQNFNPILIIELCNEKEMASTIRTVEIVSAIYGIRESFILNITNNEWVRIETGSMISSSNSTFLKLDLQEILSNSLHSYS